MSKCDKLVQKILKGDSDVTPDEARKVLEMLGFKSTSTQTGGSHLTYRKAERQSVTIILKQNPLKAYMIEKLQETLKTEGY